MVSTADGLGFGLRGRLAAPVNADLSIGIDMGVTGFILGGRDDADYVFDPQLSAIVTYPRSVYTMYILGGVGAYVSTDSASRHERGPTLHGGIGWVRALSETTVFFEVNPALVIARDNVELALPFRIGVIL